MAAVYMSLYKVKGAACNVVESPPSLNAGDIIQFQSEVTPGETSGPALAVLLTSSSGRYDVEILGAEDCDYAKYIAERSVVPRLCLASSNAELHKDTPLEMVNGIIKVGRLETELEWRKFGWFPRHRRNVAGKILAKLRLSMACGREVRHPTPV